MAKRREIIRPQIGSSSHTVTAEGGSARSWPRARPPSPSIKTVLIRSEIRFVRRYWVKRLPLAFLWGGWLRGSTESLLILISCPFRLTHPGVRRTGCGRSSGAPGLGSEGHPAWTNVFRVEFQTQGGGRPRRTALTGRPATSAWRVHPAGRKDLTPPGACSDDGGRRPWASRRSCLDRGAPPVSAPGRPCPGRGGFGHCGSR